MSVQLTKNDSVDSLNTEQLKWLAEVDAHFLIDYIERNTIFDSQLTRLLLELGAIKAQEMLAEQSKSVQKAN